MTPQELKTVLLQMTATLTMLSDEIDKLHKSLTSKRLVDKPPRVKRKKVKIIETDK